MTPRCQLLHNWIHAGMVSPESACLVFRQWLGLGGNQIGDAGLTALAKAVESGALASLKELNLWNNHIGDAGLSALAEAMGKGALDHLTVCWRPTALFPCLETPHVHSPDSEHVFDVPYAEA